MFGLSRYTFRGALALLAISTAILSCKKESADTRDAGATVGYPLADELKSRVFSLTHGFDRVANNTDAAHHLDGTDNKALITFAPHATKKNVLTFLKVVQAAVSGTHHVFGGRVLFASGTSAQLITDYYCPGTLLTPSGSTLEAIFAQMKQCSTTPDLGVPDQGAADAKAADMSSPDLTAADAAVGDTSVVDAAGAADLGRESGTADSGAADTAYELKLNKETDNRIYIEDARKLITLSRVFHRAPGSGSAEMTALLNVYERVTHPNSCDAEKPREYLLLYANDDGKFLYSRITDYYSVSGTYGIQEGKVTMQGNELTLAPVYAGECKSKLKLTPTRRPIYPANLWISATNCTKKSASQEVFYYTKIERKCGSVDVIGLTLQGQSTTTYISHKETAFPSTKGTGAHKFWSVYLGSK